MKDLIKVNSNIRIIIYGLVYLLCILSLCIMHFVLERKRRRIHWNDILMVCILVITSSIRCNFGSDYFEYYKIYNFRNIQDITILNFDIFSDKGYYILANLIKQINRFEFLNFVMVAIIIYPLIIYYFRKNSDNVTMSIFIFMCLDFFTITNNILKQSLALVILVFAYEKFLKKEYITFSMLSFIAIIFHLSSILIIGLMILSALELKKKIYFYAICILSLFITLFYNQMLEFILTKIPIFSDYSVYQNSSSSMIFKFASLAYISIVIYTYYKIYPRIYNKDDKKRLNLMIFSLPFLILSLRYITIIRISYLGIFQMCMLIPRYYPLFFYKNKRFKIRKMVVFFIIGFIILTICGGNNRYYSYSTIFNSKPSIKWLR